ncbi:hypothetical protein HHI36_000169 [Cryptolaemus montrouzieri]|uniref:Endonuclease/exonuclease/phosphatase domain-containing protein n=1 Tax=Cryptolaemus montrouzieri TaxID=559131 RepID=A0ABD2P3V5_9CUCU
MSQKEISKDHIDIAVISETKKKGSSSEILEDAYIHMWSEVTESQSATAGVSILIRKDLQNLLGDYECISERIIQVDINLYGFSSVIIAFMTKDEFSQTHTKTLESFKPNQEVFLAGDLNARVGKDDNSPVIGGFEKT